MKKIDHIGIAVPELKAAMALYERLGFPCDGTEEVATEKINTAFFKVGDSHIELMEPTSEESVIAKFLQKRGPGIHHICIEVDDLEGCLKDYREAGLQLVNQEPIIGAGGHRVAFIHPKSTAGVLLELRESSEPPAQEGSDEA